MVISMPRLALFVFVGIAMVLMLLLGVEFVSLRKMGTAAVHQPVSDRVQILGRAAVPTATVTALATALPGLSASHHPHHQLVSRWLPILPGSGHEGSVRGAAGLAASARHDTKDLEDLCKSTGDSATGWPLGQDGRAMTAGRHFMGSATNWRGLHASKLCTVTAGHADFLPAPGSEQYSNTGSVRLGVSEHSSSFAALTHAQREEAGLPKNWLGIERAGFSQAVREFSSVAFIPWGVVDGFGTVISQDAVVAASGCQKPPQAFCKATKGNAAKPVSGAAAAADGPITYLDALKRSWPVSAAESAHMRAAITASGQAGAPTIVVPLNQFWSEGYYHWFFEALPRLWAVLPWLQRLPSAKVLVNWGMPVKGFVKETLSIMGLGTDRLLQVKTSTAAEWVIVPPGAACGQQSPVGELATFSAFVAAEALGRAATARSQTAPPPSQAPRLPLGEIGDKAAAELIAAAAYGMQPTAAALELEGAYGGAVWAPPPQYPPGRAYTINVTRSFGEPLEPLSQQRVRVGDTHGDILCDSTLTDVRYRAHPGPTLSPQQVSHVRGGIDWEGTAALAGLDALCAARAHSGHRLVLLLKRNDKRWIDNHDEVKGWLGTRLGGNVTVVEVSSGSMLTQAVLFRCADVVVAPHGAGLAALLFARKGTRVVEVLFTSGKLPSTYLQASIMRENVYVPVLAANDKAAMRVSWGALQMGLQRVGELPPQ